MYQHPNFTATPPRLRVYTKQEWDEIRPAFEELYSQDYTLGQVKQLMVTNHGFHATEAQYKKKIKAWGLEKNIDKRTALGILRKESKRKYVEDKATVFKYKDNMLSEERVALLRKRHKGLNNEDLGSDPHRWEIIQADTPPFVTYSTPPCISCSTPAPVDDSPDVQYNMIDCSTHNPQIINNEGAQSRESPTDAVSSIIAAMNTAVFEQEAYGQEAHEQGSRVEFHNESQYGDSTELSPLNSQTQIESSSNSPLSAPLPITQEQPTGIENSSDHEETLNVDMGFVVRSPKAMESDINDESGTGSTPLSLHDAVHRGREDIVVLLLSNGCDISRNDEKGNSALHVAVEGGHENIAQLLIQRGIDMSGRNSSEETALHVAARNGHEKVVQLLLQSGIDVSGKNSSEETALHVAARNGHEKVVQLLLQSGINVSAKDSYLDTALHDAARNGHEKVVQLLFQSGIDVSGKNSSGETALHVAVKCGREKLVQLLALSDIDVSAKNWYSDTELHLIEYQANITIVRLLLKAGVDISVKDQARNTASDLTNSYYCHPRIRQLMFEAENPSGAPPFSHATYAIYSLGSRSHPIELI